MQACFVNTLFKPLFALVLTASFGLTLKGETLLKKETLPYLAEVISPNTLLRSGPGASYYETATVPEAASLEIMQHGSGGWCALKPLASSFSWIDARFVELLSSGQGSQGFGPQSLRTQNKGAAVQGRIRTAGAVVRVGSHLHTRRETVQLQLTQGSLVTILQTENQNGMTWYRISPPAGELRWIHQSEIRPTGESFSGTNRFFRSQPAQAEQTAFVLSQPSGRFSTSEQKPNHKIQPNFRSPNIPNQKPRLPYQQPQTSAVPSLAVPTLGINSPVQTSAASPILVTQHTASQEKTPQPLRTSSQSQPLRQIVTETAKVGASRSFLKQLDLLNIRLSKIISKPQTEWEFKNLEREVDYLFDYAKTGAEVAAMRRTIKNLQKFVLLKQRLDTMYTETNLIAKRNKNQAAQRATQAKTEQPTEQPTEPQAKPQRAKPTYSFAQQPQERNISRRTQQLRSTPNRLQRPGIKDLPNLFAIGSANKNKSRPGIAPLTPKQQQRTSGHVTANLPNHQRNTKPTNRNRTSLSQASVRRRFDAVGFLKPVISKRPNSPQFAIVDTKGKILSFVKPTPNLNLQSHLGKKIGLIGQRGFNNQFKKPELTANRVISLKQTRLR